ncbi:S-adenosyl-methyltransferase [Ornithobacterium rhinotracheale]|uniref:S-adenosyl-methyltransferase n=1 Tax=Ornithobacterium rhinotracheale TaxID=28251 RepID=A0A410JPM4_ORNRH|nr:FtsL-like putative cell division protein [Ornithobacterium rhinotracheale]QAR30082.1 S-adenosyl-methyltransferase [Ornithobacterium rhinotracheale]
MAKNKTIIDDFKDFVKGKFFIGENATKNWIFMSFLFVLALISIISAQITDKKVVQIKELETTASNLKSEYAFVHKQLMQHQMRSHVANMVEKDSIKSSTVQPYRIFER